MSGCVWFDNETHHGRDCVTKRHERRSRGQECNAIPSMKCVSLSNHTHMKCLLLSHIHYEQMELNGFCLVDVICFYCGMFQLHNLLYCVNGSWRNMPCKVKRHEDGAVGCAGVRIMILRNTIMTSYNGFWIRIVTSHNVCLDSFSYPGAIYAIIWPLKINGLRTCVIKSGSITVGEPLRISQDGGHTPS